MPTRPCTVGVRQPRRHPGQEGTVHGRAVRLTVLGRAAAAPARPASCDVLVTAPAGTALAAVASDSPRRSGRASGADVGTSTGSGAGCCTRVRTARRAAVHAGGTTRSWTAPCCPCTVPPGTRSHPDPRPLPLHTCAWWPDPTPEASISCTAAGSASAVPPTPTCRWTTRTSSRLHCAVTVAEDGRVTVADLGSTNGTTLDGAPVERAPGAARARRPAALGESALRLTPPGNRRALGTTPDGEGHVRVSVDEGTRRRRAPSGTSRTPPGPPGALEPPTTPGRRPSPTASPSRRVRCLPRACRPGGTAKPPSGETHHTYGSASWGASGGVPESGGTRSSAEAAQALAPEHGRAPRIQSRRSHGYGGRRRGHPRRRVLRAGTGLRGFLDTPGTGSRRGGRGGLRGQRPKGHTPPGDARPAGVRKRGGLSKWARG